MNNKNKRGKETRRIISRKVKSKKRIMMMIKLTLKNINIKIQMIARQKKRKTKILRVIIAIKKIPNKKKKIPIQRQI